MPRVGVIDSFPSSQIYRILSVHSDATTDVGGAPHGILVTETFTHVVEDKWSQIHGVVIG